MPKSAVARVPSFSASLPGWETHSRTQHCVQVLQTIWCVSSRWCSVIWCCGRCAAAETQQLRSSSVRPASQHVFSNAMRGNGASFFCLFWLVIVFTVIALASSSSVRHWEAVVRPFAI